VTIRNITQRGSYVVSAYREGAAASESLEGKLWEVPLAANGPSEESRLDLLDVSDGVRQAILGGNLAAWTAG